MKLDPELLKQITTFIGDEKVGNGDSYTPVSKEDETLLYDIIDTLIKAKYNADGDGDYALDVTFTNRTRFETIIHPIFNRIFKKTKRMEKLRLLAQANKEVAEKLEREMYLFQHYGEPENEPA
jgi:hypothetical protein